MVWLAVSGANLGSSASRAAYLRVTAATAVLLSAGVAQAETVTVSPGDDLRQAVQSLNAGDELVLNDGMYTVASRLGIDLVGTESEPIIIRAADGATPHIHRPNANQNIVDFDQARYVTIRGIEFSGGSIGLRFNTSSFVTIEDCDVHDTGDVAIGMNISGAVYESMQILRNHIHHTNHTGEAMYLGCNNDGCQLRNSVIAGNYIHDLNQASVTQGDGIEIKEGSSGNIVADNVIHDTNYPCILTYSAAGNGPPNIIERNLMWNCGDHAIQSAADATIRNNIILGSNVEGIAMQPHQSGSPSNLTVVHNTVINSQNNAISVRGASGSVVIANNALYSQTGSAVFINGGGGDVTVMGNVGEGGASGGSGFATGGMAADLINGNYSGLAPMDVFPTASGGLAGAGDVAYVTVEDFNGTARSGVADVGAYAFDASGNPGWVLAPGFKNSTVVPPLPGTDAGLPPMPGVDGGVVPGPRPNPGGGGGPGLGDEDVTGGCSTAGEGPSHVGWAWLLVATLGWMRRRRS